MPPEGACDRSGKLAYGHGDEQARNQLDAIKTMVLAARRQRTAEIALRQKEQDQADVARTYELQYR